MEPAFQGRVSAGDERQSHSAVPTGSKVAAAMSRPQSAAGQGLVVGSNGNAHFGSQTGRSVKRHRVSQ